MMSAKDRYINSSKEEKITLFEEGETNYKSVEEIPLDILIEELERRKIKAVPELIENINQSLNLLDKYGVKIIDSEGDCFVLKKIVKVKNSVNPYSFETEFKEV